MITQVAKEGVLLIHATGQSLKGSQAASPSLGHSAALFDVSFSATHFPFRSSISNHDAALQQHVSHCQRSTHDEFHCTGSTGKHNDQWPYEIWRCQCSQHEPGFVQGQSIHPNVQNHLPSSSTAHQLRIAGAPGLGYHLCIVQSTAKTRTNITRIRGGSLQPSIGSAIYYPRPCSDPQYATTFAWLGSV